jgi:hypothetical protein
MKKLAILVVASALTLGAVACGKKKDTSTPATGDTAGDSGSTMGGDAYGGDAYGAPMPEGGEGEANPCGGAANTCG